ncbi:MAG: tRNA-intron lyase [Desulfurococcales archaeon]|nr:tRNA-intron lyase [Desulfurococcales archaeon]
MSQAKYRGLLLGDSIVVPDIEESRSLYSQGFYGKPIGVEKPRGRDFDAPLKLSLMEALYLVEKGMLEVYKPDGSPVGVGELRSILERHPRFRLLYRVYVDLRDRGLVVRPGLKFGADFTVYRIGPGIDHAPFIVNVVGLDEEIDPIEIVRAGRLSHTVRKTFTIASPLPGGRVQYIMFKWYKP